MGTAQRFSQYIALKLHQHVACAHAAVNVHAFDAHAAIGLHGFYQVIHLIRNGIKRRAHNMRRPRSPRNTHNRTARLGVPIRRSQTRKRRYNHHTLGARARMRNGVGVAGVLHNAKRIMKPGDKRTAHKRAAFQHILRLMRASGQRRKGCKKA